jgi:hypothetical protein
MYDTPKAAHFDVTPRARRTDVHNYNHQLTLRWQLANLVEEEVPNLVGLTEAQLETIDVIVELFNEQHPELEFTFNVAQEFVLPRLPRAAAG